MRKIEKEMKELERNEGTIKMLLKVLIALAFLVGSYGAVFGQSGEYHIRNGLGFGFKNMYLQTSDKNYVAVRADGYRDSLMAVNLIDQNGTIINSNTILAYNSYFVKSVIQTNDKGYLIGL